MGIVAVAAGLVVLAVALVGGGDEAATPAGDATAVLSDDLPPGTTAPLGDGGLGAETVASDSGRQALAGFGEAQVTITSPDGERCTTCMLLAGDAASRARGLMEVTDPELGGYDGMVFVYDEPIEGSFWMRNTPLPLTIAYVDPDGTVIADAELAPCADDPTCPSYRAGGAFQYAVEVPVDQADAVELEVGSSITIDGFACEAAAAGT